MSNNSDGNSGGRAIPESHPWKMKMNAMHPDKRKLAVEPLSVEDDEDLDEDRNFDLFLKSL